MLTPIVWAWLIGTLVFSSCTTSNADKTSELTTDSLQGSNILVPDKFDGLSPAAFKDGILVYSSYSKEYRYVKATVSGDSLVDVQHFIEKGFGHGQVYQAAFVLDDAHHFNMIVENIGYLTPLQLWTVPDDGDFTQATMTKEMPISTPQQICAPAEKLIMMSADKVMLFACPFEDPNTIVSIVDYGTGQIKSIKLWPNDGFKGDAHIKANAYNYSPYLAANGKGQYVFAAWAQPYMFIFDLSGPDGTAKTIKYLYDTPVKYYAEADGMNVHYSPDSEPRQIKCTSNSDHIYVLNNDCDKTGAPADSSNAARYGDIVDVFDWKGNLVRRLHLDQKGMRIFVDQADGNLYLESFTPDTDKLTLRRYKL